MNRRTRVFKSPSSSSKRGKHSPEPLAPKDDEKAALSDNITAQLKQESSGNYSCVDFLSMTVWQNDIRHMIKSQNFASTPVASESRIDENCREQICEWSYRVVDYFRIDREVVSVSLSYLDRLLGTCSCDRSMFKLAATTTLYMAVKIYHPQKLADLGVLSDLSRGEFDMADVAEMEQHICANLQWYLHPPTSVAISSILLDYIFSGEALAKTSSADMDDIYDNTAFFGELAVCDYFFVNLRPSTVALASILNSIEGMFGQENNFIQHILLGLGEISFPTDRQELSAACNRLWELYERSEECALHHEASTEEESSVNSGSLSPKRSSTSTPQVSSPVSVASATDDFINIRMSRTTLQQNVSW